MDKLIEAEAKCAHHVFRDAQWDNVSSVTNITCDMARG